MLKVGEIVKKCLVLFFVCVILQGCTILRVDNYDYEQMMNTVLSLNIKNYNTVGNGYKYYIPMGLKKESSLEYNDILRKDNILYYLYVDVVGYYYKKELYVNKVENSYFFKELNNNDKNGFVQIIKKDNKLYVQMVYNYAKIETYVKESEIKDALCDMSYILSSIDFNDSLLKKMYESGNLDSKEEVYKIFKNKEKEGNFLEYIKEYDKYEEEQVEENEIIIENKTTRPSTTSSKNE